MKVILLKDVAKVGQKNSVAEVANGYAQFLIGQGKAEVATTAKVINAEKKAKEQAKKLEEIANLLEEGIKKLKNGGVTIHATANEKDHLFEAVSVEMIASHLKDVIGVDVGIDSIIVNNPIKELGEHTVGIKVGDKIIDLKIKIKGN